MILLIDNYDSFTWNLVHLIGGLGHEVSVHRNDKITVDGVIALSPTAIMISPGPCTPDQAGICLDLVGAAARAKIPLFGVCLGLQSIAQAFGGEVTRAPKLMHGKVSRVGQVTNNSFLAPIEREFQATRYHSLVADAASLPACLRVVAKSTDDAEIMALEHESLPIAAVQFHPESIASEAGPAMIDSFMKWARTRTERLGKTDHGAAQ